MLFAEDDWHQAEKLLTQSADKSAMPVVNLLFAARAAADSNKIEKARQLLKRLKIPPQEQFRRRQGPGGIAVAGGETREALQILRPLHSKRPNDGAAETAGRCQLYGRGLGAAAEIVKGFKALQSCQW